MMNNEIHLLAEALSTNGEAEAGGVKYIYMDDSTIYRFENNRMKKVSAAMIKKAQKVLSTQGNLPNDIKDKAKPTKKSATKKSTTKSRKRQVLDEEEECPEPDVEPNEEEEDNADYNPPSKPKKQVQSPKSTTKSSSKKSSKASVDSSSIVDLNEYYNNKNKMEFMSIEIERLNNKVNKLKQYKSIVNKITGGEFDITQPQAQSQFIVPPQQAQQQFEQSSVRRKINDDLFI